MEITFRQLQRMTVKELRQLISEGEVIVTVDGSPGFLLTHVDSQPSTDIDSQAGEEEELPDF